MNESQCFMKAGVPEMWRVGGECLSRKAKAISAVGRGRPSQSPGRSFDRCRGSRCTVALPLQESPRRLYTVGVPIATGWEIGCDWSGGRSGRDSMGSFAIFWDIQSCERVSTCHWSDTAAHSQLCSSPFSLGSDVMHTWMTPRSHGQGPERGSQVVSRE